jgi:hypothetical protein
MAIPIFCPYNAEIPCTGFIAKFQTGAEPAQSAPCFFLRLNDEIWLMLLQNVKRKLRAYVRAR